MAVGTATALAVTMPQNMRELVITISAALVGSVISDIDVSTSESRRGLNKVLGIILGVTAITAFLELRFGLGIWTYVQKNSSLMRLITGGILFMAVCIFGKGQPHRSFMHSLLAVAIFWGLMADVLPFSALPFVAAMMSHIVADLMNYKKVRLFYPAKAGVSLRLCKANGLINRLLFYVAGACMGVEIIYISTQIFGR